MFGEKEDQDQNDDNESFIVIFKFLIFISVIAIALICLAPFFITYYMVKSGRIYRARFNRLYSCLFPAFSFLVIDFVFIDKIYQYLNSGKFYSIKNFLFYFNETYNLRIRFIDSYGVNLYYVAFFSFITLFSYLLYKMAEDTAEKKAEYNILAYYLGGFLSLPAIVFSPLVGLFSSRIGSRKRREETLSLMEGGLEFGDNLFLSKKSQCLHTQIIGGSGSGKTNLIKLFLWQKIRDGEGVIFFDYKADSDLLTWFSNTVELFNRSSEFSLVNLSDTNNSSSLNPFFRGTPLEIQNQIISSSEWGQEPYFKSLAERSILFALDILCTIRDRGDAHFTFDDIYKFLTSEDMANSYINIAASYDEDVLSGSVKRKIDLFSKDCQKGISGFVSQIEKINRSVVGEIVGKGVEKKRSVKFSETIRKSEIVYVYINSLGLGDIASFVGKVLLKDLTKEVGILYNEGGREKRSLNVIVDEFASFATPDFINFLDKARGAGIRIFIAHQSMSDLKSISDDFSERVLENTASKIFFQTLNPEDAERIASMCGTYETVSKTRQVERNILFGDISTGMGSERVTEKFIVHPNKIKNLGLGQVILISSKVDPQVEIGQTWEADFSELLGSTKGRTIFSEKQSAIKFVSSLAVLDLKSDNRNKVNSDINFKF